MTNVLDITHHVNTIHYWNKQNIYKARFSKEYMNKEITMKDISDAIRYFKAEPYNVVENDIVKIHLTQLLHVKYLELKPLGKKMVDKFIKETMPGPRNTKLEEIFGIKVVVSNEVVKDD